MNLGNDKFWDTLPTERLQDAVDSLKIIDADLMEAHVKSRNDPPASRTRITSDRNLVSKRIRHARARLNQQPLDDDDVARAASIVHSAATRFLRLQRGAKAHMDATIAAGLDPEPHDLDLWREAGLDLGELQDLGAA